jgi:polyhydroxybutyrate depolymerase
MRTSRPFLCAVAGGAALLGVLGGCGDAAMPMPTPPPPDPNQLQPAPADLAAARALIAARPYDSKIPDAYDASHNWPLVILLHGYGANGFVQDAYFGLGQQINFDGFLYAFPDGMTDSKGKRFWNATDVCCDFDHTGVDDVAYIDAIIDDMAAQYRVDRRRVYLVGHSNGGFMSHRYACDRASRIAAMVVLAGDNYKDTASHCHPQRPVALLQVHGDMDDQVPYLGGTDPDTGLTLPSALETVSYWAGVAGCSPTADTSAPDRDLDMDLPGNETKVTRFTGCQPGGAAELWTIHGGGHVPDFYHPGWANDIWSWFTAHPQP